MATVRRLNLQRQAPPLVPYTIISSTVDLTPYTKFGTVRCRFVPTAV